jgi:hypothetical protein
MSHFDEVNIVTKRDDRAPSEGAVIAAHFTAKARRVTGTAHGKYVLSNPFLTL